MGKMQREKGKRGEREVAALIREYGFEARRGQQFHGRSADSPDVVHSMGPLRVEVKLREKLNVYDAMYKLEAECELYKLEQPLLFHRRLRSPWHITMLASDFMQIVSGREPWDHVMPRPAGEDRALTREEEEDA